MLTRKPDQIGLIMEEDYRYRHGSEMTLNDASVTTEIEKDVLRIYLKADCSQPRYVRLRWIFTDAEKRNEPVHVMEECWERSYGTLQWRGIDPGAATAWTFAVSNGTDKDSDVKGRYTECFGVKVRPNAMCFWQYDQRGVTLWADVRSGGTGVKLMGRELMLCEVLFREYRDTTAFRAVNAFYGELCDDPLAAPEKIYGANNWYYAYGHFDHQDIVNDAKLISNLCAGLENRPYMVIDAGWETYVRSRALTSMRNCPDMKKLAEDIVAQGAKPGIWIRYLIDKECGLFPRGGMQKLKRDTDYLDPSHPDVLRLVYDQTDKIVNEWGYRLIKHDFSTYDILGRWGNRARHAFAEDGWHFYDQSKTTAEIIKTFYETILKGTKGNAVILGCNVIGHLAAGYVHANRTGNDTSGREWEPNRFNGVNALAFHMVHNRNFYAADPDCVGATDRVPWNMNREWLRAVGCSGNTLFLSIKPGVFNEEQYDEMRRALAVNSVQEDMLEPVDWMETTNPHDWLLNGKQVSFDWIPDEEMASSNP